QALAEMRRLPGLPTSGSIPAARLTNWAHVALNRADGDVGPNSVRTFPLDEQGGFVATGLLAGIWRPSVSLRGSWVRAADFEVREGQTEEVTLTLDLDAVLPGVLAAQVTWNGAPLANTRVHLRCMTTEQ